MNFVLLCRTARQNLTEARIVVSKCACRSGTERKAVGNSVAVGLQGFRIKKGKMLWKKSVLADLHWIIKEFGQLKLWLNGLSVLPNQNIGG